MRQWLVGGALIERDGNVLLVRNERRGGRVDWSPPGGVIDAGEGLREGLTREVREETGLVVARWEGPLYRIAAQAPDLGWDLAVEVHRATSFNGDMAVEDPDGIVTEASFCTRHECEVRLDGAPRWVSEPLAEWMADRWSGSRDFSYVVRGTELDRLRVERTT